MTIELGYRCDFEDPDDFVEAAEYSIDTGDEIDIPIYTTEWQPDGVFTCPKCGGDLSITKTPPTIGTPFRTEVTCFETDHGPGNYDWSIYIRPAFRIRV